MQRFLFVLLLLSLAQPAFADPLKPGAGIKVQPARATWNTGYFQEALVRAGLKELGYQVKKPKELQNPLFYQALAFGDVDYWANGWLPMHKEHMPKGFDEKGEVLCVIDLDTVLSSTVLNDFGDAMRTYTNTGLEDDKNLDNVSMDMAIFKPFTKGYLEETASFLSPKEIEYLAFSAQYITYEQVLRFLMDYIDGDNYYKTKSADHNLVRAHAQYKLLQSMEKQFKQMDDFVKSYVFELQN